MLVLLQGVPAILGLTSLKRGIFKLCRMSADTTLRINTSHLPRTSAFISREFTTPCRAWCESHPQSDDIGVLPDCFGQKPDTRLERWAGKMFWFALGKRQRVLCKEWTTSEILLEMPALSCQKCIKFSVSYDISQLHFYPIKLTFQFPQKLSKSFGIILEKSVVKDNSFPGSRWA